MPERAAESLKRKTRVPRHPGFVFSVPHCCLELEQHYWAQGLTAVIGVDEAGRGPLAGSVVAAAALLPQDFTHSRLTDSKKLNHAHREDLYAELQANTQVRLAWAEASVAEIDSLNILKATHLAMRRAVEKLGFTAQMVLIDGLPVPHFPHPQHAVVKGDAHCLSIAAASIVAKVERDRLMLAADAQYPAYGFAQHKGYGTAAHLAALAKYGPCPLHRLSFAPVAQAELDLGL
jgi:ribonuclease HII